MFVHVETAILFIENSDARVQAVANLLKAAKVPMLLRALRPAVYSVDEIKSMLSEQMKIGPFHLILLNILALTGVLPRDIMELVEFVRKTYKCETVVIHEIGRKMLGNFRSVCAPLRRVNLFGAITEALMAPKLQQQYFHVLLVDDDSFSSKVMRRQINEMQFNTVRSMQVYLFAYRRTGLTYISLSFAQDVCNSAAEALALIQSKENKSHYSCVVTGTVTYIC